MRIIIFAYNPMYVNTKYLEDIEKRLWETEGCYTYFIPHQDNNADPIYCVQFCDSKPSMENIK